MRPPKFNFIPAHHAAPKKHEISSRVVTVNTKQASLFFSTLDPEAVLMVGKYLKFFVDKEKNTLAWKVFEKGELDDLKSAKIVEERIDEVTGKRRLIRVNISVPLKSLKYEPNQTFKKLKLNLYNSQEFLDDKKSYYYVTLK